MNDEQEKTLYLLNSSTGDELNKLFDEILTNATKAKDINLTNHLHTMVKAKSSPSKPTHTTDHISWTSPLGQTYTKWAARIVEKHGDIIFSIPGRTSVVSLTMIAKQLIPLNRKIVKVVRSILNDKANQVPFPKHLTDHRLSLMWADLNGDINRATMWANWNRKVEGNMVDGEVPQPELIDYHGVQEQAETKAEATTHA